MRRTLSVIWTLVALTLSSGPAHAGPHGRLQDAQQQLRGGHPDRALEEALAVADASPELARRAQLLAASAEEAMGRHAAARDRLLVLWRSLDADAPRAPEIRWRLAQSMASTGRRMRARALVLPLLRMEDPEYSAAARLARSSWRLQRHRGPSAWQALGRALNATAPTEAPSVRADAHRLRLTVATERAAGIRLEGRRPRARRRLTARLAWLEAADGEARSLLRLGQPGPLLAGLTRLAEAWRDLADALASAPPPPGLAEIAVARWRQRLRDAAVRPLTRSRDAWEAALRVAERDRISADDPRVDHLRVGLEAADARLTAWTTAPPRAGWNNHHP